MKNPDARTLSPETQEHLRKQAIRLKKNGKTYVAIAEIVGVHRNTVSNWWKVHEREGPKGLKAKPRGFAPGHWRTLTASQEHEIQEVLVDKPPDQLKLVFALWTRQAVQELMKIRFGITMPIRTVGEYLKRWGFTPQKPLTQAYEQRPAAVRQWLDEAYPALAKRAKHEGAEIHWGDETGVRSDCQHGQRLCAQRQNAGESVIGQAGFHQYDLIDHQPREGAVHAVSRDHEREDVYHIHQAIAQGRRSEDLSDSG